MTYGMTAPALPVPQALLDSLDEQWTALGRAGTWWTGTERAAIASQARSAVACTLCAERKVALSPYSIADAHPADSVLSAQVVDAVHRIVTDPGRLSRKWVDELLASGVRAEGLVEIAGILGVLRIGDTLARACHCEPAALPEPVAGEPSRVVAEGLAGTGAWVPMVDPQAAEGMIRAVYQDVEQAAGFVFNVVRSLTSVPAAWGAFFGTFLHSYNTHGAVRSGDLTRPQMELLAASTSAVNECFYWVAAHSSLLRASSKQADADVDMRVVLGESQDPDGGVERGAVLRRFVEALLKGSDAELAEAREVLIGALGSERAGQAARIVASFDGINRVADATGIQLDAEISGPAGQMIEELRLGEFLTE